MPIYIPKLAFKTKNNLSSPCTPCYQFVLTCGLFVILYYLIVVIYYHLFSSVITQFWLNSKCGSMERIIVTKIFCINYIIMRSPAECNNNKMILHHKPEISNSCRHFSVTPSLLQLPLQSLLVYTGFDFCLQ